MDQHVGNLRRGSRNKFTCVFVCEGVAYKEQNNCLFHLFKDHLVGCSEIYSIFAGLKLHILSLGAIMLIY
jgi:hypothetical protein